MKFKEFLDESKLNKTQFEKFLISGKSFQLGDDTLWLNSDNVWMLNTKKSDFNTLYDMYSKNFKDITINESLTESEEYTLSSMTSTTTKVNVPYLDIVVKTEDGKEAYPVRIHPDFMKYNSKLVTQITDLLKDQKIKL